MATESLVTSKGILLGYEAMDGKFPPGYQSTSIITFRVRAQWLADATTIRAHTRPSSGMTSRLHRGKPSQIWNDSAALR